MNRYNKGISTLIFNRDNVNDLIELVNEVGDFSNEIVIIDSSTYKNFKLIYNELTSSFKSKVKLYHLVPLGHPEPYQQYGLGKCKYEWIFYIDTDERPNELLKKDIKKIINTKNCDAFLIRKKELDKDKNLYFETHQCRLYRKQKAIYTGNVFYDPIINGKIRVLEKRYFLNHHFEYVENEAKSTNKYFIICAYEERCSYLHLINETKNKVFLNILLKVYFRLKNVKLENELSKTDYKLIWLFLLYFLNSIFYDIKNGKIPNFRFLAFNFRYSLKKIDFFFKYPKDERALQLDISQQINKVGGVINYLKFNNDKVIEKINRKYSKSRHVGVRLFVDLLKYRHDSVDS